MDTEELLVNLVLDETKSNATWTFEKLFERLWSALVKLRCQLAVDQDVSDVFGFVRNQVPAYVLGNLEVTYYRHALKQQKMYSTIKRYNVFLPTCVGQ